jgi:hypothetical protein
MKLNRGIGDVLLFDTGRGLHFDETEGVAPALQDVHRDENLVLPEGGFKDRRGACGQRFPRRFHLPPHLMVGEIDEHPSGKPLRGQLSYGRSLIHPVLVRHRRLEFWCIGFEDFPPEIPRALPAGDHPGFGEMGAGGGAGLFSHEDSGGFRRRAGFLGGNLWGGSDI